MENIQWEIYVKIFNNRFILKGLMVAVGIPFGLLVVAIIILSGGDIMGTDAKYALFLIGLLFIFTYILIMIIYGGKYAPGFIIDDIGITNYTQDSQGKKNKIINSFLIIFGLYSGNFSAAGSGSIAHSRQLVKITWKEINKVRYYPKHHTIIVKGGLTNKLAVFCTEDNYAAVEAAIKEKTNKN